MVRRNPDFDRAGDRLRDACLQAQKLSGKTTGELAEAIGCARTTLVMFYCGNHALGFDYACRLMRELDIPDRTILDVILG